MEGEALLNDASSFTLFTIFLQKAAEREAHSTEGNTFGEVVGSVALKMLWLGVGKSFILVRRL